MKFGKVVSIKSLNFKFILNCDRVKVLLYILSLSGLLFGFIFYSNNGNSVAVSKNIFSGIIYFKTGKDIVKSYLLSLICFMSPSVLIFVFGSSIFGVIVTPLFIISLNTLFGTLLSFSYHNYQIGGLAFNCVLLIPTYLLFLIGFVISSSAVMRFSLYQFNSLSKGKSLRISAEFAAMLNKQLVVLVIFLFDAFLEVVLNRIFIKSFNFS